MGTSIEKYNPHFFIRFVDTFHAAQIGNYFLGFVLVLFSLISTTNLAAIPPGPCDHIKEEIVCETPKPGPFAFAYPMDLELTCPRDFYMHIDALAFQAKQDGMDFAIEDASTGSDPKAPITSGKIIGFSNDNSDWDWNPGMRLGFGFFLDHDAWNIDFNWTWLNITNYKHGHVSTAGNGLIPLWILGAGDTPALGVYGPHASSVWKAHYNTIDLKLSKAFYLTRYLTLDPHFGLRGGWIDQHFSVDYSGDYFGTKPDRRVVHHGDNHFWGLGLRIGVNSEWILGTNWCVFANIATSILASKFLIKQQMLNKNDPATGIIGFFGFDIDDNFYQNVPNTEMAIGIAWNRYFNKSKYRIGLTAAYELIEWWDQLNMRRFFSSERGYANDTVSRGNLTLNGFSLKVQLDL